MTVAITVVVMIAYYTFRNKCLLTTVTILQTAVTVE